MSDENKNCDILFEYLRCILYEPDAAKLDIEELDEPYRKLGQGLKYLEKAVAEMKECSAALANGNLAEFNPRQDNPFCDNLKGIYSNLLHLTWQAKQVAKGDYSQDVSYLGDFSEAFNNMTTQLREREEALVGEALYDPLTNLGNRNYFTNRMNSLVESGQEIALCYIDLDGLKYVNDTYGHAEGDAFIKSFADILRRNTRGGDILARMGGDEFCVVLEDCSVASAESRMKVIQKKFADSADDRYERCFSFGVVAVSDTGTGDDAGEDVSGTGASDSDGEEISDIVECDGDEKKSDARCCDWETAMKRADEYMYRQKSEHKHCRV